MIINLSQYVILNSDEIKLFDLIWFETSGRFKQIKNVDPVMQD